MSKIKRILTSAVLMASAAFALAACGGQAHAAGIPSVTYTADNGIVFSLNNVRQVNRDQWNGVITLTYVDGSSTQYDLTDASGAVFNKIKQTQPTLILASGKSNVLYNPTYAKYLKCDQWNGSTIITWYVGSPETVQDNGCLMFNAIKNTPN